MGIGGKVSFSRKSITFFVDSGLSGVNIRGLPASASIGGPNVKAPIQVAAVFPGKEELDQTLRLALVASLGRQRRCVPEDHANGVSGSGSQPTAIGADRQLVDLTLWRLQTEHFLTGYGIPDVY